VSCKLIKNTKKTQQKHIPEKMLFAYLKGKELLEIGPNQAKYTPLGPSMNESD